MVFPEKKVDMKKQIFFFFMVVFSGVFLCFIYENWPVVQSEGKVRRDMLELFPVGTDQSIVWRYAKSVDPGKYGAYKHATGWRKNYYHDELVGISHINASISNIGVIDVSVIWIFDKDNNLIDIVAWKTMDMP